jgi:hypothetical protein
MITTAWVGGVAFVCLGVYAGLPGAGAWIAGVALGMLDLYFLNALLLEAIGRRRKPALALFGFMKFVAIYAIGSILLFVVHLRPWFVLTGFSLFLAIIFLKIVGRLVLTAPGLRRERQGGGGPLLRNSPSHGKAGRS